ncbi:ABC transporter permease [soil metagenome]
MAVPFYYIHRNLRARRVTTLLTIGGMALVVFVFATMRMLAEGIEQTLVETGRGDNVMVIRRSAETEVQSSVDREQAAIVESLPHIAHGAAGERFASKETLVLLVLAKRGSGKPSNITLRGLSAPGLGLRPQVRVVQGRMFRPGTSEIIAGVKIAQGFAGTGVGERIRLGGREWTVVGLFDAGNSGFGSEIWGDVDQLMQAFRRNAYSSVIFRLADRHTFESVQLRINKDPRLTLEAKPEIEFYAEQSEVMSNFLTILGTTLSITFAIGAVLGAMITMYSSVAERTSEIATLRALGFRRRDILSAFITESCLLGLVGGTLGILLASLMQTVSVSTMNWQTFAELSFDFTLTPAIVMESLVFALVMGLAGGLLPALRAARLRIAEALRYA